MPTPVLEEKDRQKNNSNIIERANIVMLSTAY